MVNYSQYIYEIIPWLRRNGVTVHEHAFALPCSGMYRSETREIFLNEPRAFYALLALAHEAGHWLGYLIDEKPHSYQRERQAYVYGWYVLRWFNTPITRATWRMYCRGCHAAWKRGPSKTEHLYRETAPSQV
jgi:hypothetical protein